MRLVQGKQMFGGESDPDYFRRVLSSNIYFCASPEPRKSILQRYRGYQILGSGSRTLTTPNCGLAGGINANYAEKKRDPRAGPAEFTGIR
ncbi:hypothetical protein GEV33_001908 [Tenebrio molitor]|uniref:Uncharacterized protein n=1 Tax=Tenebrio molitor TaxID=7067 RepID=A0A8J6LJ60_TENMO|nr:hypothetical protein GEV33_001908 [Tenebrio molitor]